jgi:hypothetical protein
VRLVASSRSEEWERERMGAQLGMWQRKKGGLAAGKTRGRRRRARVGGVWTGKILDEEKPMTGGARLMCWRFKSNQTIQNNSNEFEFKSNLFKLHFIQT